MLCLIHTSILVLGESLWVFFNEEPPDPVMKTKLKPIGLPPQKKGLFHVTEQNPTSTFFGHKQTTLGF